MNIIWIKSEAPQGKKTIPVEVAAVKDHENRFVLYKTSEKPNIDTMWSLHDFVRDSTHWIYGEGWDGARVSATKKVKEILAGKFDPKPRKSKRSTVSNEPKAANRTSTKRKSDR
jgi:hypothetical protein